MSYVIVVWLVSTCFYSKPRRRTRLSWVSRMRWSSSRTRPCEYILLKLTRRLYVLFRNNIVSYGETSINIIVRTSTTSRTTTQGVNCTAIEIMLYVKLNMYGVRHAPTEQEPRISQTSRWMFSPALPYVLLR